MSFEASGEEGRVVSSSERKGLELRMASHSFTHVYLLRSEAHPERVYVGRTTDLRGRLDDHIAGKARHTSNFRPWKLETHVAFSDPEKAAGDAIHIAVVSVHEIDFTNLEKLRRIFTHSRPRGPRRTSG